MPARLSAMTRPQVTVRKSQRILTLDEKLKEGQEQPEKQEKRVNLRKYAKYRLEVVQRQ